MCKIVWSTRFINFYSGTSVKILITLKQKLYLEHNNTHNKQKLQTKKESQDAYIIVHQSKYILGKELESSETSLNELLVNAAYSKRGYQYDNLCIQLSER